MKQKTHKIRIKLEKIEDKQLTYIVLHTLDSFSKSDKHHSVTFQEVSYVKELLKELEQLEIHLSEQEIFSTLDKLLIYLNF